MRHAVGEGGGDLMVEVLVVAVILGFGVGLLSVQAGRRNRALDKPLVGPECDEPLRAAARGDLGPLEALLARLRHESFSEHDHLLLAVGPLLPLETTLALTEERGGDPVAHLLAGSALIAEAWKARGSGWGGVSPRTAGSGSSRISSWQESI